MQKFIAIAIMWVVYFGFAGPWLISADSYEALIAGLVIGAVFLNITYRVALASWKSYKSN